VARDRALTTQIGSRRAADVRSPAPRSRGGMRSARCKTRRLRRLRDEFKDDCLDAIWWPENKPYRASERRRRRSEPTATQTRWRRSDGDPDCDADRGGGGPTRPRLRPPAAALRPRPRRRLRNCQRLCPSRRRNRRSRHAGRAQSHDSKVSQRRAHAQRQRLQQRPPLRHVQLNGPVANGGGTGRTTSLRRHTSMQCTSTAIAAATAVLVLLGARCTLLGRRLGVRHQQVTAASRHANS